ncbi:polysaccharide deacetylase family protein [Ruminococcus flavefaciens]|uniref:polysaccharide deacetylase family protein n=1 Tax=Ruminococcus flavefaciens TaxID=1265 RepID=UPI000462F044|nr:polysaccharide deacetylase family protein [Ruminococcus flavefaciens]
MYRCLRLGKLLRRLLEAGFLIGFFVIGSELSQAAAEKSREAPVPLPVIMYHSVCEKEPADYIVSPSQLDADLDWLSARGFTAVSAQQLIDYTCGKGRLPKKPVLITFDDGFYNNLSLALPILEKHDMCAVVSIVGRYTDDYASADPHADCYSYLTWSDISELAASGRVEIGSHTYDMHSRNGSRQGCAKLPEETAEEYAFLLRIDIGLLRTELHENCGIVPAVFAYPFGALSKESLPVLRDSGILMTLTCREGMNTITRDPDCLYGIFRYNRSGLLSTEEYMERITKELPEA